MTGLSHHLIKVRYTSSAYSRLQIGRSVEQILRFSFALFGWPRADASMKATDGSRMDAEVKGARRGGGMRRGVHGTWRSVFAAVSVLTVTFGFKTPPVAAGEVLQISNAWTLPADREGVDLPLLMTVTNDGDSADALVRVRCPVANFAEKHTVDRGEGAPAMRPISAIPIPAKSTLELKKDGYHVMLLQVRQTLSPGATFNCSIVFQKSGTIETEVHVK